MPRVNKERIEAKKQLAKGLRKLIFERHCPARIRIEALDRYAFLFEIYSVVGGLHKHKEVGTSATAKTGDAVDPETGGQEASEHDMIELLTVGGNDAKQ